MDGASYLIGLDLHLTRERMGELFRALEEKKRVVALLRPVSRFFAGPDRHSGGLEDAHPAMRELALIGVTVDLPSGVRARIAVWDRYGCAMNRVISAVRQIGDAFETL